MVILEMESGRFFGQVVNQEWPYENWTLGFNETLSNGTWSVNETLSNGTWGVNETLMVGNGTKSVESVDLVENRVTGGHLFWMDFVWLCLLFLAVAFFGVEKTVRLYASGVARRRQRTWREQRSSPDGHLAEV